MDVYACVYVCMYVCVCGGETVVMVGDGWMCVRVCIYAYDKFRNTYCAIWFECTLNIVRYPTDETK